MASLIGSSRIVTNTAMRARTAAAIRQTAAARLADDGAAGRLARAALLDPEFVVSAFLVRIAVNPAVINAACSDCGYSDAPDGDLEYIVADQWDNVAASEFPEAEGTA